MNVSSTPYISCQMLFLGFSRLIFVTLNIVHGPFLIHYDQKYLNNITLPIHVSEFSLYI